MRGQENAKKAIKSSDSGTANFDDTSFSEQSRHDLIINDLALLCTVLEDSTRRAALLSFAGDSVTFPDLSFCLRSLGEGKTDGFLEDEGGRMPSFSIHGDGNCTRMTKENELIKMRREP
ncbi:hypothetical protein FACUT_2636 [Fusarium acutatum]|uniref:Uncharacterized protein n=1 Tax=Fusarium acutatum TaxID=78861 RepID=A0A8H4K128_9HYPO|nr:hypothetical protein FACUT_2636 [Fusarium acutatum]